MRWLRELWSWFDRVTGTSALFLPALRHPVPPAGKAAWLYVFGSATLVCFLLQIVTGIVLATTYVTSSGSAYDSLQFITDDPFGRVVRGIHYYSASGMVLFIGIHALRVYLMAAYKYPRQFNWLSGVVLLLLTMGMAFTGQLLRWDQTGVWSAVIAAEQAGRTPLIGTWLGHFILAGDTFGGATLSRFFALHVFFIPALIFAILALHLWLVLHNGISEPPRTGRPVDPRSYRAWYRDLVHRQGVPFWPDAAWRDAAFGVLVIAAIVFLAWKLGPVELGRPPDPTDINASPRPDWYLLWYFALLSLVPHWSEDTIIILGPLLLVVVLVLLPLVAYRGERSLRRRPWAVMFALLVVGIIGYYWPIGIVAPWSPRFEARPLTAAVVGTATGPVATGARVFYDKGCEYCHAIAGEGGLRGPDLSDAGVRMTRAQMVTRIFSGAANMPSYTGNLPREQLEPLLDFLQSRRGSPPASASSTP